MRLISHRGNIMGPSQYENNPNLISEVITKHKLEVEIDLWNISGHLYLGHSGPVYKVEPSFFKNKPLLVHCKNIAAIDFCLNQGNIECFWHDEDDYTFTSSGNLIAYPGRSLTNKTIAMKAEHFSFAELDICAGLCSDYIAAFANIGK